MHATRTWQKGGFRLSRAPGSGWCGGGVRLRGVALGTRPCRHVWVPLVGACAPTTQQQLARRRLWFPGGVGRNFGFVAVVWQSSRSSEPFPRYSHVLSLSLLSDQIDKIRKDKIRWISPVTVRNPKVRPRGAHERGPTGADRLPHHIFDALVCGPVPLQARTHTTRLCSTRSIARL